MDGSRCFRTGLLKFCGTSNITSWHLLEVPADSFTQLTATANVWCAQSMGDGPVRVCKSEGKGARIQDQPAASDTQKIFSVFETMRLCSTLGHSRRHAAEITCTQLPSPTHAAQETCSPVEATAGTAIVHSQIPAPPSCLWLNVTICQV
jgi:hypothetical protein